MKQFEVPYTNNDSKYHIMKRFQNTKMILPYTLHFNIPYTNVMEGSHEMMIQKWVYISEWIYIEMACSHVSKIQKWEYHI